MEASWASQGSRTSMRVIFSPRAMSSWKAWMLSPPPVRSTSEGGRRTAPDPAEEVVVDQSDDRFGKRIPLVPDLAERSPQPVVNDRAPEERLPDPGHQRDRLGDHEAADDGADGRQGSGVLAAGDRSGFGWNGEQVAIGRAVLRPADAHLTAELVHGSPDGGNSDERCSVIDEVPGGKVVAPVEHEIEIGEEFESVRRSRAWRRRARSASPSRAR